MTWHHNQTNISSTPSTSSQEQEAAFSLTSYLDTIQSERVKLNPTQEMSSSPDNETDTCQTSQSGTMSAASTEHPGEDQLMFFAEDSPAKTSVRRVKAQELLESVQSYGRNMRDSLARCNLDLSLPKTHHCFALGDLELSSKTWPRWGIMLDGELSELGLSVRPIKETECGSWPTIPTPTKTDGKGGCYRDAQFQNSSLRHFLHGQVGGDWASSVPHPSFAEAAMGFPPAWTDLQPVEMHKFRNVRPWHSVFSQKD